MKIFHIIGPYMNQTAVHFQLTFEHIIRNSVVC